MQVSFAFEQPAKRAEQRVLLVAHRSTVSVECVAPKARGIAVASWRRCSAIFRYAASISLPMLFLPVAIAARFVVPVPTNGSRTVSPANENSLIKRSAKICGYGAGWPRRVDSPLMSTQAERSHDLISFLVNIESAFWIDKGERYSPPFLRKSMYSASFLMIAPG